MASISVSRVRTSTTPAEQIANVLCASPSHAGAVLRHRGGGPSRWLPPVEAVSILAAQAGFSCTSPSPDALFVAKLAPAPDKESNGRGRVVEPATRDVIDAPLAGVRREVALDRT
jgi:hypothetical protein